MLTGKLVFPSEMTFQNSSNLNAHERIGMDLFVFAHIGQDLTAITFHVCEYVWMCVSVCVCGKQRAVTFLIHNMFEWRCYKRVQHLSFTPKWHIFFNLCRRQPTNGVCSSTMRLCMCFSVRDKLSHICYFFILFSCVFIRSTSSLLCVSRTVLPAAGDECESICKFCRILI